MADKPKKVLHRSPVGKALFANLITPDKKFDKVFGTLGTSLVLPEGPEAQKFIAQIDAWMEESQASAKAVRQGKKVRAFDPPYSYDEERGEYRFVFRKKAGGLRKADQKPWKSYIALFDATNAALKGVDVWGGSIIQIAFEVRYTLSDKGEYGVRLSPEAVQVKELVTKGSRTAAGYGFDADPDATPFSAPSTDTESSDDAEPGMETDGDKDEENDGDY